MEASCKFEGIIMQTHEAVYGNGDIKHGLLWKMDKVIDFINNVEKVFWPVVIAAMIGSMAAVANLIIK
jgi:hypothetical protein